jgi:streptogramin lyase
MNTTAGNYNIGTSSTNVTGLKNAFLTVGNLVNTTNGNALATTPNGNGTVPQGEINTLANIIGACVNTATGSTICSNLMSAAKPTGGTMPTDTLGAMLDIALNPGNNVSTLYGLPSATPPFAPPLGAQPNDWTLAVKYTGGGLSSPWYPAVDANGNVWVPDDVNVSGQGVLSEFSTLGVSLQGTTGVTNVDVPENPTTVAIKGDGTVWAAGPSLTIVGKLTSSGTAVTTYNTTYCNTYMIAFDAGGDLYVPYLGTTSSRLVCEVSAAGVPSYAANSGHYSFLSIAIDASGHLWTPYGNDAYVREWAGGQLVQGSQTVSDFSDSAGSSLVGVAIDAGGNAWISETGGSIVTELSSSGTVLSGSGYTVAGTSQTIAVDGANTIWTAGLTNGTLTHLTNAGAAISPAAGYKASGATAEYGMALDASGNIWTTDSGGYLFEWVGAAAPVATPLVQQIVNSPNTLGARP